MVVDAEVRLSGFILVKSWLTYSTGNNEFGVMVGRF